MKDQPILSDERTVAVENASYRLGYIVMTFGLLLIVVFRGFFYQESNWDLMALVILGSLVTTVYQAVNRTLPRQWFYLGIIMAVIAAAVASAVAFFLR